MTDNTPLAQPELTQRKVAKDQTTSGEETTEEVKEDTTVEEEAKDQPKQPSKPKPREEFDANWKYYWYIFRYYHFKVADTIDLYCSAACLWVINLYLRLFMGIGPEPASALTEE